MSANNCAGGVGGGVVGSGGGVGGSLGCGGSGVKRSESNSSNYSNSTSPHQPTWRYWGEERCDGAIYTVYLKKVRYFNPNKAINNDADDEIAHLEWETVRVRMIKAGTMERLVESLATDTGELESSYVNVFLATYRSFASTEQVLSLLLDRYRNLRRASIVDVDTNLYNDNDDDFDDEVRRSPKENAMFVDQLKKTLRLLLSVWLDAYPDDFRDPPTYSCLRQMLDFATNCVSDNELELRLRHRMDKFLKEEDNKSVINNDLEKDMKCKSPPSPVMGSPRSPRNFLECSADTFAEQLTFIDAELFKRVSPHHCLGSVWSRRDRPKDASGGPQLTSSVIVTIDQFNAVSYRVISTVLVAGDGDVLTSLCKRARVVVKWIEVAQRLRVLKNFSSLKAIISGLQSNPVYRLRKTWLAVPREKMELFDELARIFSEENNQMVCRELLMKEGTAKVAANVGENDRHMQKAIQRQLTANGGLSVVQGTVPYLGTFLTDLTMIDTAIPDVIVTSAGENLINFDKKRKEFEVLAQIKLLQLAANAYRIKPDPAFRRWFDCLPVLDDKESYDLSCQMEPQPPTIATPTPKKSGGSTPTRNGGLGHRKTASIASTSSSSASSQFFDLNSSGSGDSSSPVSNVDSPLTMLIDNQRKMSTSSSSSSLPSLDVSSVASLTIPTTTVNSMSSSPFKTPDFYVIRVSVEADVVKTETDGVILYKSIMLSNSEHTPSVIRNAMLKHGLCGDADDYRLVQILPHGEIVFPTNANVYYAINTAYDLNFVLRRNKGDYDAAIVNGLATIGKKSPIKVHKTLKKKISLSV